MLPKRIYTVSRMMSPTNEQITAESRQTVLDQTPQIRTIRQGLNTEGYI